MNTCLRVFHVHVSVSIGSLMRSEAKMLKAIFLILVYGPFPVHGADYQVLAQDTRGNIYEVGNGPTCFSALVSGQLPADMKIIFCSRVD